MGGGGIRSSLNAVIYHGMLHGLMLIAAGSVPIQQSLRTSTPGSGEPGAG